MDTYLGDTCARCFGYRAERRLINDSRGNCRAGQQFLGEYEFVCKCALRWLSDNESAWARRIDPEQGCRFLVHTYENFRGSGKRKEIRLAVLEQEKRGGQEGCVLRGTVSRSPHSPDSSRFLRTRMYFIVPTAMKVLFLITPVYKKIVTPLLAGVLLFSDITRRVVCAGAVKRNIEPPLRGCRIISTERFKEWR